MRFIGSTIILTLGVLISGCINISTRFQPDDLTVKEELKASDCVPIIFGIGIGTADIEEAKQHASKMELNPPGPHKITKVRRVELNDLQFLMFGAKCVDVVGEP